MANDGRRFTEAERLSLVEHLEQAIRMAGSVDPTLVFYLKLAIKTLSDNARRPTNDPDRGVDR
jgi:hypothetical protein